jgi:hypothetical protein
MTRTKVVAYGDDLLIAIRGNSVRAVENYANAEMSKINEWSKRNKIKFNGKKSKVMLVTRRKKRRQEHRSLPALPTLGASHADEMFGDYSGS